jgi:exopolyphosphatase/guanosine-5'-triphosphate,3'-diphosphate pyrophosphatase
MSVIDRFSRIVRLGEGMGKTGRLSNAAIDRTTEALKVCASKIISRGVYQTRAIATEACRQAANDQSFFRHVEQETGIQLRTITSTEEAKLTLDGCMSLLTTGHPRILMFDIGGGSTELIWLKKEPAREPSIIDILSLPFGVVSLAEEYGPDALSTKAFEEIINRIDAELEPFENNHRIASQITIGNVHVLGASGTVTTMGSIYLNQARYARAQVDGLSIRFESIHAICKNLFL